MAPLVSRSLSEQKREREEEFALIDQVRAIIFTLDLSIQPDHILVESSAFATNCPSIVVVVVVVAAAAALDPLPPRPQTRWLNQRLFTDSLLARRSDS